MSRNYNEKEGRSFCDYELLNDKRWKRFFKKFTVSCCKKKYNKGIRLPLIKK